MEKKNLELIIVTGPPYSGKGIQSNFINSQTGFKHLSTGDKIREEKKNKTSLGRLMKDFEESGILVPDNYINQLFQNLIIDNLNEKGLILDGFPRTVNQAEFLDTIINTYNIKIFMVFNINVDFDELLRRALERSKESERIDDQKTELHLKRIEIFSKYTRPAIEVLKSKYPYIEINGMEPILDVSEKIRCTIEKE